MYKPPGQKQEPTEPISISCRFVPTDQWLRTHVDPHWTISELKRHLLARCVGGVPLVPGLGLGTPGPRLLVPSPSGHITLSSLVRQSNTAPIKTGGRPSTAPHALLDDKRKPRLSLKVVPSLPRPVTTGPPRAVTIHPPTPGIHGVPSTGILGQQSGPSVYFSPRNPVSSPELSPPSFTPGPTLDDEASPPSPNIQLETMSISSRSTVALDTPSPSPIPPVPPSRVPPLFTPSSEHSMLFSEFASTTPSATAAPPSPYAVRPPTNIRSPPPPSTARSPPLSSSLTSRYEASLSNPDSSILESDMALRAGPAIEKPQPPAASPGIFPSAHGMTYPYDIMAAHAIARKRSASKEKYSLEEEFRLVSFAQGCILDEHCTVADLRIRPGELFEIQRKNAIVHLGRSTYTQPFFEAPIYVIKRTVSTSSQQRPQTSHSQHHHYQPRPHQHHIQPVRDYSSSHRAPPVPSIQTADSGFTPLLLPTSPIESISTGSSSTRVRSRTVTARDRDPYDALDADLEDGHEYPEFDMSGLDGVGGGTPLPTGGSGGASGGVMAKQNQPMLVWPLSTLLSAQQLPAVPHIGSLPRNYIKIHFTGPSRKDRGERDGGIGIRMMDGAVHVHLLRVLLRVINNPGSHGWLPTDTPIIAPAPLSSQYPEWRQYIIQRAWLAGRGASIMRGSAVTGPWMRPPWVAWTDKEAESFTKLPTSDSEDDSEDDYEDQALLFQTRDSDSEIEWDTEPWRAWESENVFGNWNAEKSVPCHTASPATPTTTTTITASARYTSGSRDDAFARFDVSELSATTSPNTRRARSSTIAGPDSPGNSGSPQAWARTGAGIETVLRTPASSETMSTVGSRRPSNQTRRSWRETGFGDESGDAEGDAESEGRDDSWSSQL
ncbi:She9/mdm33 family containing protein [Rhizoctonia solani]|uniref:She9/mdm33 family containing protein n=1 Tax=Rhizoctonia solani TaxID=456999 RepID=A0A8H8SVT4_9AGAM|nr:She9/mdm33 family containing protein [Rhizoctonia solani]QRW20306.1 She9/mdm33 family containing protein [Rhizoctonia solani]